MSESPSRTYVAMCHRSQFSGFYFKKFTLPEDFVNNTEHATWFFLNRLNLSACVEKVVTVEDYQDITIMEELNE